MSKRAARAVGQLLLRTEQTPLRRLWKVAYEAAIRTIASVFVLGRRTSSVYVKSSFGFGEPVYGLSDIDLVVVSGSPASREGHDAERALLKRRWHRLSRALGPLRNMVQVFFYDRTELREVLSEPCLTYGLDQARARAAFLGPNPLGDELGLQERPELYGPMREWRLVGGPAVELNLPTRDAQQRRLAAWLELQLWWRYVFPACLSPPQPWHAYLCVKLVAEPARIWLWIAHDEIVFGRRELLERAARLFPEEEDAFRFALQLHRALPQLPAAPLAETLQHLVRLSSRIAAELRQQVRPAGTVETELLWDERAELALPPKLSASSAGASRWTPLADWRAVVVPPEPDEAFRVEEGRADDPARLADAARARTRGTYHVLEAENLLVFPAGRERGEAEIDAEDRSSTFHALKLRSVQCVLTDPVSFAVASGAKSAAFPDVAGWSVEHWARRAVAEHRAWLETSPGGTGRGSRAWVTAQTQDVPADALRLGRLFTALRAALLLESVERGEPRLALTARATADELVERAGTTRAVAEEASGRYHAWRHGDEAPPAAVISAFEGIVAGLPAYRR